MSLNNMVIDGTLLKAIKKFKEETGEEALILQMNEKFFDYILDNYIPVDFKDQKEQQKYLAEEQHAIIKKLAEEGKI